MALQLERPLIVFDVETTGTDPKHDRIIELAAIKLMPDGTSEEKCRRFNPQMPIPKDATRVHGISDNDIKNEPPFSKFVRGDQGIASFFRGCDLCGFNIIGFDIPILQAEFERAGENLELKDVNVVDAFRIFTKYEPRNLTAAVAFYCNENHEGAHAALADVQATLKVLNAQLERYPDLPNTPASLDLAARHEDAVDRQGKLKWIEGEVSVSFGRHKARSLKYLAREEPDYLRWMIDNDVVPDAQQHLRDALVGHFASPEKKPTIDQSSSNGDPNATGSAGPKKEG